MCMQHNLENLSKNNSKKQYQVIYYIVAISFAIFSAMSGIIVLQNLGKLVADIFINMFKCISMPIIATSIIVTFIQYDNKVLNSRIWQRALLYTLTTTMIAASLACILYILLKPSSINVITDNNAVVLGIVDSNHYFTYLAGLVPANIIAPFLEHKIMSVLLLSILVGVAIRNIKNEETRSVISTFFKGGHEVLIIITTWIVKIVPIGLYGFITVTIMQFKNGFEVQGLFTYLSIIILANLMQGFIILPAWLYMNGIKPFVTMHKMLPALSVAFFSKSSAGTLPITIETVEKNINVDHRISKFILPLCTTINMNGCAAFIFVTVIYVMQVHSVEINAMTLFAWIFISTIAAIGNAGVPMGCFFLSASLLSGMNIPINLLGLILPLYSLIDMLETALNVWSDICVTKIVDQKEKISFAENVCNI